MRVTTPPKRIFRRHGTSLWPGLNTLVANWAAPRNFQQSTTGSFFQEIRTILSAKHRWPQHLQAHVLVFWGALGRATARRGSSSAPDRAVKEEEIAPMGHLQRGERRPDAHHLQQWTDAAVRRHKRLAADALAYIRPAPMDCDGVRISRESFAESILADWGGTAPPAWPEEVGQQHPHPVWDCAGGRPRPIGASSQIAQACLQICQAEGLVPVPSDSA